MIHLSNLSPGLYYVIGWGKSGRAAAESLRLAGARVATWDDNEAARQDAKKLGFDIVAPQDAGLTAHDTLVLAPGIPLTHPTPHPAVEAARKAGAAILGDIELLFQACPQATFVGITGTNGKSTTTSLIAHILKKAGHKTEVGGNLGTPALALEPLGKGGVYVLELSSFQLDLIQSNPLNVAVLLNITPDHFDRHGDMAGYCAAKTRIIRQNDPQTLIIGVDEKETRDIADRVRDKANIAVVPLSVTNALEDGFEAKDQVLYTCAKGIRTKLMDLAPLARLPGTHNAQNIAAAFAACQALGLSDAIIRAGIESFPGLAHRQQIVAEIDGIAFINDSKATNADAAAKALVCYDPIFWIIGGKPKPGGLSGLEPYMSRVQHAFLIGQATEEFAAWCEGKVAYTRCGTLEVAVERAFAAAQDARVKTENKPVVLLSPACASFDQFPNFEARGTRFAELALALQTTSRRKG